MHNASTRLGGDDIGFDTGSTTREDAEDAEDDEDDDAAVQDLMTSVQKIQLHTDSPPHTERPPEQPDAVSIPEPSQQYKNTRIAAFVALGLKRAGCTKDAATLKYLGVESLDAATQHIEAKMALYNAENPEGPPMNFSTIELDHIKPVQAFAYQMSHYTNIQPLLVRDNRIKGAKWSAEDEDFWRKNIDHCPQFTDIYEGTALTSAKARTAP